MDRRAKTRCPSLRKQRMDSPNAPAEHEKEPSMLASRSAVAVLVGAVFSAYGCSQESLPTSPTSTRSITASVPSSVAITGRAEAYVPFEGTLQGTDTDSDPTPSTIVVTTDGSGIGTLLGRFSFTQRVTLSFATRTTAGVAHWVAANGDSIDTTVAGSGHPTGTPGEIDITDIHIITGGTGRFAGTDGSFTVQRLASAITFTTSGSYHGTIASPGAAR
jgi:hypothetical protein